MPESNPFESPKSVSPSASFDVRRQELSPQVRSYVDTLYVQIRQIFDKYGVANIEDLRDGVKSKQIKMESKDGERLINLTRWLRDTLKERKIPEEAQRFSPEHLKALDTIFGQGNLEEVKIPDPAELTPEYFDRMYPEKQRTEDKKKGLVSCRSDFWDNVADKNIVGPKQETWGHAYVRSMKHEAQELVATSSLILVESIQKPNFIDGGQQYGSKDGNNPNFDPLLSLFKEAFGKVANRFCHSWDDIQTKLLPLAKARIEQVFKYKGIPVPDFEVILEPALVFNHQTTEIHPEISSTNTWERSSTILLTQDSKDSGHRLIVGNSGHGGASGVDFVHRSDWDVAAGARLAVVFKKPKKGG